MIFKMLKLSITSIIFLILASVAFYAADRMILVPNFFETNEEKSWAKELNAEVIDYYAQPWIKSATQTPPSSTNSEKVGNYVSPAGRYQFIYKGREDGFYIVDAKTDRTVLNSKHWVVHPSEVKWLFDEKYIAYLYSEADMIGVQRHYVYVGDLRTGKIAKLTTAKSSDAPSTIESQP